VFHAQVRNRVEGAATPISAVVLGPVAQPQLQFRTHGAGAFTTVAMTPGTTPGTFTAVLPGSAVTVNGVEYSIIAGSLTDGVHAIGVQRA
jgi:hypothetical protein